MSGRVEYGFLQPQDPQPQSTLLVVTLLILDRESKDFVRANELLEVETSNICRQIVQHHFLPFLFKTIDFVVNFKYTLTFKLIRTIMKFRESFNT